METNVAKLFDPDQEMVFYIDKRKSKRGIVLVRKEGDLVRFSWSFCSPPAKFSKEIGIKIARNRLTDRTHKQAPNSIKKAMSDITEKAAKKFKTTSFDLSLFQVERM